jgi:hypothetical protein
MTIGAGGGSDSWLLRILNRIFRCPHQRQTRPITPRGGGQTYAVCLDCGMRLAYDLTAMRVGASVSGSIVHRQESGVGKEKGPDVSVQETIAVGPDPWETMLGDSHRVHRNFGTPAVLWIGAITLAGGLLYLLDQPTRPKNRTAPQQARPPISARSVRSSPSLPMGGQEPDTELASAHEATTPPNSIVSTEPNSLTENKTMERDLTPPLTALQPDPALRLEGQGSVIILGREAKAALELSQHPERLRTLIRGGSLFTVPRGTAIKVLRGSQSGNRFVLRVRIMEGSMAGQEGWAQKEQAQSASSADSLKSSPSLPVQEDGTGVAPHPQASKLVANPRAFRELTSAPGEETIAPDYTSVSAVPQPRQGSRLESKGSVIVLGREAGAAVELLQHPEMIRTLIRGGSLFTVPRGTAIRLLQGNRFGTRFVIKVRIMEGSKVGQEGWAQASQVSP